MSGFLNDWFGCCAFAAANPEFFTKPLKAGFPGIHDSIRALLIKSQPLWGDPSRSAIYASQLGVASLPVELPRHVFPVFVDQHRVGMMVPVNLSISSAWAASDAFGKFNVSDARDSLDGLMILLERLEDAIERQLGAPAPLRWRRAYSFSIGCPIHAGAIDGESLQVPLLLGVLREFCASRFTVAMPLSLPFGNGPVFATGRLAADGSFGRVGNLTEKLDAYLREFPSCPMAVLTKLQIDEIKETPAVFERIDGRYLKADNLKELLDLDPFRRCLPSLAQVPETVELDSMFDEIGRLTRSVRFGDARKLADWLLPSNPPAPYQLRLLLNAGLCRLHEGSYTQALEYLRRAESLIRGSPALFGADDRATLFSAFASALLDSAEPEEGLRILEWAKPLEVCTIPSRVRVQGTACQLFRSLDRWDEAVSCGQDAINLAQLGFASEVGRDLNYLIHALLRRAASPSHTSEDLRVASERLEESMDVWAPRDNASARAAHLGFCHQYQAEIARLRGVAYEPAVDPPWSGEWGFPRIFVLLACARNPAYCLSRRIEFARRAETQAGSIASDSDRDSDLLFGLFHGIVCLYHAWIQKEEIAPSVHRIRDWCHRQTDRGTPGWERRFTPALAAVEASPRASESSIERLLAVLPYL